jgi:epoxide hydrolase-like predicted phosphatase
VLESVIKAFLFDYGGVMTSGGAGTELSERLGESLGISSEDAFELLKPLWNDYACGKIDEDYLWASIEKGHGAQIEIAKRTIWNTWNDDMQPFPEMLELVQELRAKGFKVGLLSNVIPNTAKDIRDHGGYDGFEFSVLSCDVGYMKPQPEIYKLAMDMLPGIEPQEVVFVDDQERMLLPAQELGMQTILAKSVDQITRDINKYI